MSLIIRKGETCRLNANLTKIRVGLDGKLRDTQFELDASCLILDKNGQVRSDSDVIFYNQPESPCGSARHLGGGYS
ncbi:MAG: TerD family protein [Thermoguttaceae bacterium]|nr:TerD family protein [Thermoguttaceae bacterium]